MVVYHYLMNRRDFVASKKMVTRFYPSVYEGINFDLQFPSLPYEETELVKNVTENGTTVDEGHFSKVTVNVSVPF